MLNIKYSLDDMGDPTNVVLVNPSRPQRALAELLDLNGIESASWHEIFILLDGLHYTCQNFDTEFYIKLEVTS